MRNTPHLVPKSLQKKKDNARNKTNNTMEIHWPRASTLLPYSGPCASTPEITWVCTEDRVSAFGFSEDQCIIAQFAHNC